MSSIFGKFRNNLLWLIRRVGRLKNTNFLKPAYYISKKLGLVKLFNKHYSGLKEITFNINILGAKLRMIDRTPNLIYFKFYKRVKAYEPALTKSLHDLLKTQDNPTFVDIGAHLGYFSILTASWIKDGNPVYSFEPNPDFFKTLSENIAMNNLQDKIRPYQLALSNKKGKAKMGGFDARVMNEDEAGDINTITFDQFCENEGIEPEIIKIDVHGAEGKILDGMPKVLKTVSHVFCETHHKIHGFTVEDIVQKLKDAGLNVFLFTEHRKIEGGNIVPIENADLSNHDDLMLYGRRD
ncbi:FkbM family methyltransferase [uncultured Draconibacterium sp.]|uniref:FkbM family methyltransferase n=1 Tax=uncultured Draconibacterium sp. TaxID=1573823 RepID=UPI002AA8323D|nr:FkbM family methyltransferase [uncultured Draconibacterium sp.]